MTTRTVRFVFKEKVPYHVLKSFIEQRVPLTQPINQIYTRQSVSLELGYAFVIFDSSIDARKTVEVLNGFVWEDNPVKAELIGPDEPYERYLKPRNMLEVPQSKGYDNYDKLDKRSSLLRFSRNHRRTDCRYKIAPTVRKYPKAF